MSAKNRIIVYFIGILISVSFPAFGGPGFDPVRIPRPPRIERPGTGRLWVPPHEPGVPGIGRLWDPPYESGVPGIGRLRVDDPSRYLVDPWGTTLGSDWRFILEPTQ
jgi:hypothetical protein